GNTNSVVSVSAASYVGPSLAVESIATAFGIGLSTGTFAAPTTPLPTSLAGSSVKVKDKNGVERLSPLFYVSANQINYQIPPGPATGRATVTITSGSGVLSVGPILISTIAPGLFTADASGSGLPTANLVRVKSIGVQQIEPVARFDVTQNKWVAVPI